MLNDPIIVWPPGTFYLDCNHMGNFYDCTNEYPWIAPQGAIVCCPGW